MMTHERLNPSGEMSLFTIWRSVVGPIAAEARRGVERRKERRKGR